ncbi:MAG TPA: polysaccharide biosynthesis C-terminal domain-containing protein [Chitinophagaceae bacterium]|nr:polysaccharide biosynthesis C-terminal domain-containing protein [Chitinophagaceae bacterium]
MKSSTRFYAGLLLMIMLNVVIKPAWVFGIDRQVQNQVGPADYGTYFSLFNLSVVFIFLLDWGLTTFFNRQLAMANSSDTAQPRSFLQLKLLFSLLYAFVVCSAAWITGVHRWDIVVYVILIQVFYSLFMFFRATLTARQFFLTDAWLSIIDKSLMLLIGSVLLYYPAFHGFMTIERFAWLQAACLCVAMLVALICLWKKGLLHYLRFSGFPGKKIFKQALPFALIVLLMSVHARLDAFLLERMNTDGAYESGIYAAAYRLLDAANMVGTLTVSFLLPYIARRWSGNKDINEVVLTGRHFLLMLSIGISCVMVFMGDWVQQVLYHHNDAKAVSVLQWCLPALIGYSLTQIYGTVLTATGHIRSFCVIVGLAALINIVLNFLLIPSLGAKGCCIAALFSQLGAGIAVMLYASQKIGLYLHPRSLLVYIFTAALLSVFLYAGNNWPISKELLLAMAAILTLLVMLLTGMLKPGVWLKQEKNLQ